MRRLRALLVILCVALASAACGSAGDGEAVAGEPDEPPTVAWARQACTILSEWSDEMVEAYEGVADRLAAAATDGMPAYRSALGEHVESLIAGADRAVERLDDLGPGPSNDGEFILDVARAIPASFATSYRSVAPEIDELPDDVSIAEAELMVVEAELEGRMTALEESIDAMDRELEERGYTSMYPPCDTLLDV